MRSKTFNREKLIGSKFGFLEVLEVFSELYGNQNQRKGYAKCLCSCGIIVEKIMITHLKSGKIVSCGHYNREVTSVMMKEKQKKYNNYFVIDEFTMGRQSSNDNKIFIFDMEDYDKIKEYYWSTNSKGYATSTELNKNNNNNGNKKVLMHRIIMDQPANQIDHEDRNRINNKKYNLKLATPLRNAINRSKQKNNTTGFIGVNVRKDTGKYTARIWGNLKVYMKL